MQWVRFSTCAVIALTVATPALGGELAFEGEAALASDYRWRGVSLSDENPSAQLEATAAHESGAWAWSSLYTVGDDYGGVEIGLGLGYTRAIADVEWTLGATRYFYPGEADIDYTQLDLSAAIAFGSIGFSGGVEYAPAEHGLDDDTYFWIGADWQAAGAVTLHGHVGRNDGAMAPIPRAIDYSIGASIPLGPIEADLSYVDVETEDGALVLRLSYAFVGDDQ